MVLSKVTALYHVQLFSRPEQAFQLVQAESSIRRPLLSYVDSGTQPSQRFKLHGKPQQVRKSERQIEITLDKEENNRHLKFKDAP